jgi:hypothetical protein
VHLQKAREKIESFWEAHEKLETIYDSALKTTKIDANVDEVKVCKILGNQDGRKISCERKHEFFFRAKIRDLMQCEGNRDA